MPIDPNQRYSQQYRPKKETEVDPATQQWVNQYPQYGDPNQWQAQQHINPPQQFAPPVQQPQQSAFNGVQAGVTGQSQPPWTPTGNAPYPGSNPGRTNQPQPTQGQIPGQPTWPPTGNAPYPGSNPSRLNQPHPVPYASDSITYTAPGPQAPPQGPLQGPLPGGGNLSNPFAGMDPYTHQLAIAQYASQYTQPPTVSATPPPTAGGRPGGQPGGGGGGDNNGGGGGGAPQAQVPNPIGNPLLPEVKPDWPTVITTITPAVPGEPYKIPPEVQENLARSGLYNKMVDIFRALGITGIGVIGPYGFESDFVFPQSLTGVDLQSLMIGMTPSDQFVMRSLLERMTGGQLPAPGQTPATLTPGQSPEGYATQTAPSTTNWQNLTTGNEPGPSAIRISPAPPGKR